MARSWPCAMASCRGVRSVSGAVRFTSARKAKKMLTRCAFPAFAASTSSRVQDGEAAQQSVEAHHCRLFPPASEDSRLEQKQGQSLWRRPFLSSFSISWFWEASGAFLRSLCRMSKTTLRRSLRCPRHQLPTLPTRLGRRKHDPGVRCRHWRPDSPSKEGLSCDFARNCGPCPTAGCCDTSPQHPAPQPLP